MEGVKVVTSHDLGAKVCGFFLQHKGRPCRMLVKAGRQYCGQHLVELQHQGDSSQHRRIHCPLDPKHSCFEHRLQHHLTICNAREVSGLPHVRTNCNLRQCGGPQPSKVALSTLPDQVLLDFITKIERIHTDTIGSISESMLSLSVMEEAIAAACSSPSVVRHLCQTSSLLAHMQAAHFLDTSSKPTCYVEFGAGRGQLTNWLTEVVTDTGKAAFVLVDRGAQRYKYDAKLKYKENVSIKRIRVDIQHLWLEGVEGLEAHNHIVGFGKHLCGSAADMALRCLCQYQGPGGVGGAVLALCCHHRCSWDSYCGTAVLERLGVSPSEFYILTALTGWATCNSKDVPSRDGLLTDPQSYHQEDQKQETYTVQKQHQDISLSEQPAREKHQQENRYTRLNLSAQHREEVGKKAKQVLDYGRAQYMREQGFQCSLVKYVAKETTPENIALIATAEAR